MINNNINDINIKEYNNFTNIIKISMVCTLFFYVTLFGNFTS